MYQKALHVTIDNSHSIERKTEALTSLLMTIFAKLFKMVL